MTVRLTTIRNKQNKEKPEKVPYTGYDAARALLRTAYMTIPPALYAATSEKIQGIKNMSFIKKFLADVFYNGKIERLNQLNESTKYATGVSAALAAGYALDTLVENTLPSNKEARDKLRKPAQIASYITAANIANAALTDQPLDMSLLASTFHKSLETLTNFTQSTSNSDLETMTNLGITTLLGIAAIKGADYVIKSKPAKAFYNLVKNIYNHSGIIGRDSEVYEERRSRRILANRKNQISEEIARSEIDELMKRQG